MEKYSWSQENEFIKQASITVNPTDSRLAVLVILDGYDTSSVEIGKEEARSIYDMLGKALGE